jgi:uracil-DNA glycosylase
MNAKIVVFVGSNPPRPQNVRLAFLNTRSGKTLRSWRAFLGCHHYRYANVSEVVRKTGRVRSSEFDLTAVTNYLWTPRQLLRVIALGRDAQRALSSRGIMFHAMPHPSGRCRAYNSKKETRRLLEACKAYIEGYVP